MFDPITSAIIASSPQFSGLDHDTLPKRLTEAYADIVSARISLRGQAAEHSERLRETLGEMSRLAAANEAYVALLSERENRAAAAFVAGSAYQACLFGALGEVGNTVLNGANVPPEVCASLLFLAADAHADAAESAKRIVIPEDYALRIEDTLLFAIKMLCKGNLEAIRRLDTPQIEKQDPADRAIQALHLELLMGVKRLSARLLRRIDVPVEDGGIEPPSSSFSRVKQLSIGMLGDVLGNGHNVCSMLPGPLHLANLLLAVDRDLVDTALTRILPPDGVTVDGWWTVLRRIASSRPYLWRNHRQAIDTGYLNIGTSAVVSFPTGGGKSTLAELKIATALLREKKVIFLVPTHALVDQTTRSLKRSFDSFEIVGDVEDEITTEDVIVLPEVIVTTPERCLMLLSSQDEAFNNLGLIVFDECHLLHPRSIENSRRSIDSMLAVLNLARVAPDADFLLLSAMMKNAEEIASWICHLTDRPCKALNLSWKPTRQVRGCIVYSAQRIAELEAILSSERLANPKAKGVSAPVKRQLTARPYGFFSLQQTWASQKRDDYTLLPIMSDEYHLSTSATSRRWYLTPNGIYTSSIIAAASSATGVKTLVFIQTIPWVESAVKKFEILRDVQPIELTNEEIDLYKRASDEMGGAHHCYLRLSDDGRYRGGAVSHHSLLLREERVLHESMFRRSDGVDVLFATSTLAQGMNLPSEMVIISGDSRFDPEADKLAQLEAHELLNAAGRAGRAGESSQGMVLIVPSRVVDFDDEANTINKHWMNLHSIFSQSDQCLDIEDPLTPILDAIHAGTVAQGMPAYLLSRLPAPKPDSDGNGLKELLRKSLAAYHAKARGDEDWVESRISAASAAREITASKDENVWLEKTAALTGVSAGCLSECASVFNDAPATTVDAIERLKRWLEENPARLIELVRPENLSDLFSTEFENLDDDHSRGAYAIPLLFQMLDAWMAGLALNQIEDLYTLKKDLEFCRHARHFVLRLVPDLAFIAGLPARLMAAKNAIEGQKTELPIVVATLGAAVREGCDSPEALAVTTSVRRSMSRVAARKWFEELKPFFEAGASDETFETVLSRMDRATAVHAFSQLD